ncbi:MAG TPA: hypothetical protein VFE33_24960 [Thermoanaerobaculia bacterium]|nr:hypothetical protein [Thermoanaerobaculia bacterium]
MRGTFFFVHGTGVRDQGWVTLWRRVQDYARINGIDGIAFKGCAWYKNLGVPVDHIADTLPPEVVTRSVTAAPPSAAELEAARWALLLDDPLFELRLGAQGAPAAPGGFAVGRQPAEQAAVAMVQSLGARAGSLDLAGTDLAATEIAAAIAAVARSAELGGAARAAGSAADPELVRAVSRGIVAAVLSTHRFDEPGTAPVALLDGGRRDLLVEEIAEAMAPAGTRSALTDWLKKRGADFLLRKATSYGESHREGLMGAATPAAGDVLYYQRRGGEMLDLLTRELAGCEPPVVAVGHSLGGIMLVDLLSRQEHPRVDLLVTAGSQSPMLYAIDALEGIRWGKPATRPFTPWLNIYNRQDFLSFRASKIFAGVPDVEDVEVDPKVPFPESHSAYWYHDKVYELIRKRWPA